MLLVNRLNNELLLKVKVLNHPEEACSAYKAEIEQIVYQINQVPTASHLIDMLQNSLQVDRTCKN